MMENKSSKIPESINLHITNYCNYHCHFCFAHYVLIQKLLTTEEWKSVIHELAAHGCKKVNFAGGEPTLVSFLPELISYAKSQKLFVSFISNGSGISSKFLDKCGQDLDLIGLSIDSGNDSIEQQLGRCSNINSLSHVQHIKELAKLIHDRKILLKINTTLTSVNCSEDMHAIIHDLAPFRWKVFQVHKLHGINDEFFNEYGSLSDDRFAAFLTHHEDLNPVGEYSEQIKESYCMITPDGRFYQDTENFHHYSDPILTVGVVKAFHQIRYNPVKYLQRNGDFFEASDKLTSY